MLRVEIVVVGSELLDGSLADTHTASLGAHLGARGLRVRAAQIVPDDRAAIAGALALAAERADLVLVTGGLGPTEDDISLEAAAAFAGLPLVEHTPTLERIRHLFSSRGLEMTPNNARQALVPAGAEVLPNPVGTAPAVRLEAVGTTLFFFPGVPRELERLIGDHLDPWLAERAAAVPLPRRVFRTFGRTESQVATRLEGLARDGRLRVAYRASFPEIRVTLTLEDADPAEAATALDALAADVRARLGSIVYAEDGHTSLAEVVGAQLVARGETLAAAESCTGGLLAAMVTDVPGASRWFIEGAVTYSNAAKTARLGVPAELIEEHGAVSEEVARAMAEGIRDAASSTWGVSVTGVAGPTGGTPAKPVGTVHLAVAGPAGTAHRRLRLGFDRPRNRILSAWAALDLVRRHAPPPEGERDEAPGDPSPRSAP